MPPLKDILGKPGKGIHAHGWLGIAWADVAGTVILATAISYFHPGDSHWYRAIAFWFLVLLLAGETLHMLIGVDTTVVKWIMRRANRSQ